MTGLQQEVATSVPEIVGRIERDWRVFRGGVRDLGRARLGEVTSGGWTYKDLLAHVIGWLEDVPRTIDALRAGTYTPPAGQAGIDAYNARSIETRRLVGPEALLDELDTAYRRVLAHVRSLTAGDLAAEPRLPMGIAVRTYLHWEEHLPELGGHAR